MDNSKSQPVSGHLNSSFTKDMDGATSAVIVNPRATHSQRIAWALGQLEVIGMMADVADGDGEASPAKALAASVRHLLAQSSAVLSGVLDEMENPPESSPQPLRAVSSEGT